MIAISITTRNRKEAFEKSLSKWNEFLPSDAKIFVVDDNSEPIYADSDFYFPERVGIPKAKNKSLQLAYESGAEHIFLVDDDIYPIVKGWELPYINSGANHLCYTFTEPYGNIPERRQPKRMGGFNSHLLPNGCMMYFTRECVEKAGGFDERFGMGKYEHLDLTRRIYNLGLIPYPNIDIIGSNKLFHSMDKSREVQRTIGVAEAKELTNSGNALFNQKRRDKKFIEFRK